MPDLFAFKHGVNLEVLELEFVFLVDVALRFPYKFCDHIFRKLVTREDWSKLWGISYFFRCETV